MFQGIIQGILHGRSFYSLRLWGLVEDKLNSELGSIWTELLKNESTDLEALLNRRLQGLARKLEITLSQGR